MQKLKEDLNPWNIKHVPYERELVQFVDSLIEVANRNGSQSYVTKDSDWQTINYIYRGWKALYPISSAEFEDNIKKWQAMSRRHGIAREGEAMIQHQLEIPRPFYEMVRTIFPDQKWDKKFVSKFAVRMPMFKGTTDAL